MIKFKIGDKVKCLVNYAEDPDRLIADKIYTISSMDPRNSNGDFWLGFKNTRYADTPNWKDEWFELVKKEPVKTELEWLDRVQDNFRE